MPDVRRRSHNSRSSIALLTEVRLGWRSKTLNTWMLPYSGLAFPWSMAAMLGGDGVHEGTIVNAVGIQKTIGFVQGAERTAAAEIVDSFVLKPRIAHDGVGEGGDDGWMRDKTSAALASVAKPFVTTTGLGYLKADVRRRACAG